LDGALVVFRASDPFVEPYADRYLGWAPLAKQGVDDFIVPGDHSSMTLEPAVRVLAVELDQRLRNAQRWGA
jgi:thioesterase domain-containing protein